MTNRRCRETAIYGLRGIGTGVTAGIGCPERGSILRISERYGLLDIGAGTADRTDGIQAIGDSTSASTVESAMAVVIGDADSMVAAGTMVITTTTAT